MSYAVIKTGGKQYKVKSGEISKSRYDSYIQIINDDNLKHR